MIHINFLLEKGTSGRNEVHQGQEGPTEVMQHFSTTMPGTDSSFRHHPFTTETPTDGKATKSGWHPTREGLKPIQRRTCSQKAGQQKAACAPTAEWDHVGEAGLPRFSVERPYRLTVGFDFCFQ